MMQVINMSSKPKSSRIIVSAAKDPKSIGIA